MRAPLAETNIRVVDASRVNDITSRRKDDSFRGSCRAGKFHPGMLTINYNRRFDLEILGVLASLVVGELGIDMDEQQTNAARVVVIEKLPAPLC